MRIGLRYVKGLSADDGRRLAAERRRAPFVSMDDFTRRAPLNEGVLARLAEAGAFESLAARRRDALWQALGLGRAPSPPLELPETEGAASFHDLTALQTTTWDYHTTGLSPRAHPLGAIRPALQTLGLPTAKQVSASSRGQRLRYAGLVICRQQPGTAGGVTFMTLEDETGFVNLVIWRKVFEQYKVLIKTTAFLGVTGKLQVEQDVVHLVADSFWKPNIPLADLETTSHDFH